MKGPGTGSGATSPNHLYIINPCNPIGTVLRHAHGPSPKGRSGHSVKVCTLISSIAPTFLCYNLQASTIRATTISLGSKSLRIAECMRYDQLAETANRPTHARWYERAQKIL